MTFIVAEIGVNWDGDFELLKKMMNSCKSADCNAVKFQAYNEDLIKIHPQKDRLLKSNVTQKNIEQIDRIVKDVGLEWFATPMYPEIVEILDPFVKRFKIREFDGRKIVENEYSELFEKILETNKEIIISSQKSPKNCNYYGKPNIKWLYCIPKYPSNLSDLDFSNLSDFDGYSNHVPKIIGPLSSVILGAKIIEIHITSNKQQDFIDNNVSFDFDELHNLVKLIRESEKIKRKKI